MRRTSSAIWKGSVTEGAGSLSSTSGVLHETPYSFSTRFKSEDGKAGTNPEELIAAAHAGCYTMALSAQLSSAGFVPVELKTEASVNMENVDGNWIITSVHLDTSGDVPNISEQQFLDLAQVTKESCPVSKALNAIKISLSAKLI